MNRLRSIAPTAMLAALSTAATAADAIAPLAPPSITILTAVIDSYPSPSPDGTTLLFQSNRNGRWALYTSKHDGTGMKVLLDSGDDPVTAVWSPDGARIAFAATVNGDSDLFVMNADASGRRALAPHPGDDSHPHWSADGARIFFNSPRNTPDLAAEWGDQWHDVYSVAADGTGLQRHTQCKTVCTYPVPSPDGKRIAFRKVTDTPAFAWDLSASERNSEVFVADLDGSNETNVSRSGAYDGWPMWSPDGRWIAFSSNRAGPENVGQIYLVRPDGTQLTPLTTGGASYAQPSWSRDGRAIYAYRVFETPAVEYGHIARITLTSAHLPQ